MKRKVILITAIYLIFGIFTSCHNFLIYDVTICDIEFAGLNSKYSQDNEEPDRFFDKTGFRIESINGYPTCYVPNVQIFGTVYAFTKGAEYQNHLLKSTYELSFDRQIVLNNDTIAPNTDLLDVNEIYEQTDIEIYEGSNNALSTIIFRQELIDQVSFEFGEYLVTFKCSTSDNREFIKTRIVIFKE